MNSLAISRLFKSSKVMYEAFDGLSLNVTFSSFNLVRCNQASYIFVM